MRLSASTASISVSGFPAKSPSVTIPCTLPCSTTGRRRICKRPIRAAAALVSMSPSAVTAFRDIISRTRVRPGSRPAARQRVTMSRSVKSPVGGTYRQRSQIILGQCSGRHRHRFPRPHLDGRSRHDFPELHKHPSNVDSPRLPCGLYIEICFLALLFVNAGLMRRFSSEKTVFF